VGASTVETKAELLNPLTPGILD